MNAIKLGAVFAIIETVSISHVSDIEEELRQKFHDEYLSIFENNDVHK